MSGSPYGARWGRLVALTLRLIGLMVFFLLVAIVGIVRIMDRRLSSEEGLAVCLWVGLFIGILCGMGVHIAILHGANRNGSGKHP